MRARGKICLQFVLQPILASTTIARPRLEQNGNTQGNNRWLSDPGFANWSFLNDVQILIRVLRLPEDFARTQLENPDPYCPLYIRTCDPFIDSCVHLSGPERASQLHLLVICCLLNTYR